jgi:hypothetical protein
MLIQYIRCYPPYLEAVLRSDLIHVAKYLLCLIFLSVPEIFLPSELSPSGQTSLSVGIDTILLR